MNTGNLELKKVRDHYDYLRKCRDKNLGGVEANHFDELQTFENTDSPLRKTDTMKSSFLFINEPKNANREESKKVFNLSPCKN
jgi:hypothetical protein